MSCFRFKHTKFAHDFSIDLGTVLRFWQFPESNLPFFPSAYSQDGDTMPRTYCFQYEFSAEIAASAAAVFIQKPKHKLDAKFWKGFASLVGLTALGGLGVLLSMTLEVDAPVLVAPLIFLGVFGSLLVIVLSLHLFAWAMGGVYPLIRWKGAAD